MNNLTELNLLSVFKRYSKICIEMLFYNYIFYSKEIDKIVPSLIPAAFSVASGPNVIGLGSSPPIDNYCISGGNPNMSLSCSLSFWIVHAWLTDISMLPPSSSIEITIGFHFFPT